MNVSDEVNVMSPKERKSSEEIITILAKVLTTDPQSINQLAKSTEALGTLVRNQAILRHIELLLLVQELFAGKKIRLEELNTGGQVFRTVWLELEEK